MWNIYAYRDSKTLDLFTRSYDFTLFNGSQHERFPPPFSSSQHHTTMSEDEAKITSDEEEQEDEPEVKTPKGKRGRPAKGAAKTPTPKKAGKKEVDEVSVL